MAGEQRLGGLHRRMNAALLQIQFDKAIAQLSPEIRAHVPEIGAQLADEIGLTPAPTLRLGMNAAMITASVAATAMSTV